jgi:hypothetical protein
MNLLSIMDEEEYQMCDSLHYVKHEGEELNVLELVDNNLKVDEMLRKLLVLRNWCSV